MNIIRIIACVPLGTTAEAKQRTCFLSTSADRVFWSGLVSRCTWKTMSQTNFVNICTHFWKKYPCMHNVHACVLFEGGEGEAVHAENSPFLKSLTIFDPFRVIFQVGTSILTLMIVWRLLTELLDCVSRVKIHARGVEDIYHLRHTADDACWFTSQKNFHFATDGCQPALLIQSPKVCALHFDLIQLYPLWGRKQLATKIHLDFGHFVIWPTVIAHIKTAANQICLILCGMHAKLWKVFGLHQRQC